PPAWLGRRRSCRLLRSSWSEPLSRQRCFGRLGWAGDYRISPPVVSGPTHSARGWPSRRQHWVVYGEEDTTDSQREGTLPETSLQQSSAAVTTQPDATSPAAIKHETHLLQQTPEGMMWSALGRVRWTQRARFPVALEKGSVMCYEPSWILSRMPSP